MHCTQDAPGRRRTPLVRHTAVCFLFVFLFSLPALGANPVPMLYQPLVPGATLPAGPQFTLTVNGFGFVSSSIVYWNADALTTTYVSSSQLTAIVPAAETALRGTASVTVVNPPPGGGTSNNVLFSVTVPAYPFPFQPTTFTGTQPPLESQNTGTADFNGDGILDSVTAGPVCTIAVQLGGTSPPPTYYSFCNPTYFPEPAWSIVVADFNGDGKLDIAVGWKEGAGAGIVTVFLGNGDGTFNEGGSAGSVDLVPKSMVAADFNGDGILDLAVAGDDGGAGPGGVEIFIGNGDGTFSGPTLVDTQEVAVSAAGDFYGDGRMDLLGAYLYVQSAPVEVSIQQPSSFGTLSVGTSSTAQALQVQNTGVALLTFTSIQASANFAESDNCQETPLALNASCTISVTFIPTTGGLLTGTLTLTDNSASSPQTVQLSGTGVLPAPNISPLSLSFSNQLVGTTSASQPVSVTNNGTVAMNITNLAISSDWTQSNNCLPSVAPSGSCTINVSFAPTASGARNGSITITDTGVNSPQTVNLSGTGLAPVVSLSTTSLTFPGQLVSTTSTAQPITLTNTGTGPLTSLMITTSGDFAQTNNCAGSVAVNSSCTINVTFTPTVGGSRAGTLTLTDNALNSPQTLTLSGTGLAPVVGFSQPSLSFGNQNVGTPSVSQQVTLSNTGNAPLTISSIATTQSGFSQTNSCGPGLAAGASCQINVTFTPSSPGTVNASLTVMDNASDSPESVSLTGTGLGPIVTLSQPGLSFGNQLLGTPSAAQQLTLSNTGNAPLTISSIATTQGSFSQTNNCGTALAASFNCTMNVTFTPSSLGTVNASLTITDNASGSPQTGGLSGTGIAPAVSLSGSSLSFGNQLVSTPSAAQTETVTNTGTANLTISTVTMGGTNASDFAKSADTCTGATVTPNGTCTVSVTFTPSATGSRSASLNFTDNACQQPADGGFERHRHGPRREPEHHECKLWQSTGGDDQRGQRGDGDQQRHGVLDLHEHCGDGRLCGSGQRHHL